MDHKSTVLLTRPEKAARRFADALQPVIQDYAEILIAPMAEIVPLASKGDITSYQTLIFTSENAVDQLDIPPSLVGRAAYCVGDRTADVARAKGLVSKSASGNVVDLERLLMEEQPPGPWVYVAGDPHRVDLATRLSDLGHKTDCRLVYRQAPLELEPRAHAVLHRPGVILPLFSPSAAQRFAAALPEDVCAPTIVAISSATAEAWTAIADRIVVAEKPNAAAMLQTVMNVLVTDSPC